MVIICAGRTIADASMAKQPCFTNHPRMATSSSETLYTVQDFAADSVTCHASVQWPALETLSSNSRGSGLSVCSISFMADQVLLV